MKSKGQVSMEILIVLAILIVVGVAFGVYYLNTLNKDIADIEKKNTLGDIVKDFNYRGDEILEVEIHYDGSVTCTAVTRFAQGAVKCSWDNGATYSTTCTLTCAPPYTVSVIVKDYKDYNASRTITIAP